MFRRKDKLSARDSMVHRKSESERRSQIEARLIEDLYAMALLQPLLADRPLLPLSGAALRPFCLAHILNDIVVNRRRRILEFGAGISTIVIGRLLAGSGLDAKVLAIDHDDAWAEFIVEQLEKEGLNDQVSVAVAPLRTNTLAIDDSEWYDTGTLNDAIADTRFDMVIVDGPPAHEVARAKARYPALPFVKDRLRQRMSIYLDDANRAGERAVLDAWTSAFELRFRVTGGTLAYVYRGQAFFTEPLKYQLG